MPFSFVPAAVFVQGCSPAARAWAAPGMAAVVRSIAPLVSLYVNDYNESARAAYRRVGFTETGRLMRVLFQAVLARGTTLNPCCW